MKQILKTCSDQKHKLCLLKQKLNEEINDNINKTIQVQSILQKRHQNLKEENNIFLNSYLIATSYIKDTDPFFNLKNQYSERGYKIPNLSLTNNIFRLNPLLAGNDREIQMYYNVNTTISDYKHKPRDYLNRVQKKLNKRISKVGKKKLITFDILSYNTSYETKGIDDDKNMLKENILLKQYNKSIDQLIKKQFPNISKRKIIIHKGNTVTVSKFNTQKQKNTIRCLMKQSVRPKLLSHEGSIISTEDNINYNFIDTSTTDVTHYQLNSQETISNFNKNRIVVNKQIDNESQNIFKHSNSHMNEKKLNINSQKKSNIEQSNLRSQNLPSSTTEKIFESKKEFFEYLREIEIESLTSESLFSIVKGYLRNVKHWKEESIKQYLLGESILDEINGLVVDFNKKISLYDIVGCLPDKSKNAQTKKVMKLDSIARKLPKYIIQRMIRENQMKHE